MMARYLSVPNGLLAEFLGPKTGNLSGSIDRLIGRYIDVCIF